MKNENENIKIIIKIICFQEMIYQRANLKNEKVPLKYINDEIIVVRKNVMKIIKDFFDYEALIKIIKKDDFKILNPIKDNNKLINYDKINDDSLKEILNHLPEKFIYPQKKKNIEELFDKMEEENEKELKTYKYIKFEKPKEVKLALLDDFEIINIDIYHYFKNRDNNLNPLFIFGNIIIENKYMFILIKHINNLRYEIGKYNENKTFKIEYILNKNNIGDSKIFLEFIKEKGINYFINNFNFKKNKEDIYYLNYNNEIIACYKVDTKNIKIKPNKKNNSDFNDRIKTLLLLSIYHIKYFSNQLNIGKKNNNANIEDVFPMNPKYINFFYFNEIKNMIYINEANKNEINNIDIKNLSMEFTEKIIKGLNSKILKKLNQTIEKTNNEIPFIAKKEKMELINHKKIIFYNEFVLINRKIFEPLFKNYFDINLENQNMSFISNNNNDILSIFNKNQNTIFIGKFDNDKYYYKIEYILDFENSKKLNTELNNIKNFGFNSYINKKLILEQINKNDHYIFPIFSNNELIAHLYKYNISNLNYNNIFNYIEYSKNLSKILSLYIYYKKINNKLLSNKNNNFNFEKYYLINHNLLNNIKKDIDYDSLNEYLDKNISNINNLENNNKENIFFLISILSPELLNKYKNNDFNQNIYINNSIEPEKITFNYLDDEKKNKNIMIYNNFEIIEKTVGELLFSGSQINTITECIFINEFIIVNLPNNLNNNKFISLIGLSDYENNYIIKYLFIYFKEDYRKKHLKYISNQLESFINNNNFKDINPPIVFGNNCEVIGIIVKYKNQILNKNENNNDANEFNKINNNNQTIPNNYNVINNNINYISINNPNYKKTSSKLEDNFKCCPKIGLQNIGATCYMNATLQCFCHIKEFVQFFKYKMKGDIIENKKSLSYSFKILIDNLWPNEINQKYFSPEDFKNKISEMNPLFRGIAANDSKDLVNFIILTLHLELNEIKDHKKDFMNVDQTEKELVFQNFCTDFIQNNNSIISNLFYATNCNITQCCNCNLSLFNYQTYFFLVFPLEEVRKFIYQNNYSNNIVDICQCFEYDRKINYMFGDNSMYCNRCKMNTQCCMKTNLVTGPNILIIILNRGKGIQFDVKIKFYEYLNLNNYIEHANTGSSYQLIGVITHIGESSMSGHFIAFCRDPLINNKWYKYNDAIVSDVKDFENEVINFAMPYLLFYQKINP